MDYSINEQKRTLYKRSWIFMKNFTESLLGPLILLLAKILRVTTGYKEHEKLELASDHGNFKKGTDVIFVKLYDNKNPFEKSLVVVKIGTVSTALPEYMLKEKSYLKRFLTAYEFNAKMIKGNWRLGKSHPFIIMKILYSIVVTPIEVVEWIVNKFKKDKDETFQK